MTGEAEEKQMGIGKGDVKLEQTGMRFAAGAGEEGDGAKSRAKDTESYNEGTEKEGVEDRCGKE